jgi:hypothetical protein
VGGYGTLAARRGAEQLADPAALKTNSLKIALYYPFGHTISRVNIFVRFLFLQLDRDAFFVTSYQIGR